jgi:hypothetical protein
LQVSCSAVVVGMGVTPAVDLLPSCMSSAMVGKEEGGGVRVDGRLRPLGYEHTGIFVVGDLAVFPLPRYGGKRFRHEHVWNARQGHTFL